MKQLSSMLTMTIAQMALENILAKHPFVRHFKVGKTTQTLTERFSQEYDDKYSDIALLYDGGTNGAMIDTLEEDMIQYCLATYGNDVCDNKQYGGGPACKDNADANNTAKLYVVWK